MYWGDKSSSALLARRCLRGVFEGVGGSFTCSTVNIYRKNGCIFHVAETRSLLVTLTMYTDDRIELDFCKAEKRNTLIIQK